jgi:16S rRNA G966 N2-methylase RsmD
MCCDIHSGGAGLTFFSGVASIVRESTSTTMEESTFFRQQVLARFVHLANPTSTAMAMEVTIYQQRTTNNSITPHHQSQHLNHHHRSACLPMKMSITVG